MRYSNRLFLYAPLFVLLALAAAAALRWYAVAGGLENWLREHNGHEIAHGVILHFASESIGGFPFNVDAVLTDVTIGVKSARVAGSWHADDFAIHELTFGRAHQIYEAAGKQTVFWTDAMGGPHRFVFIPGSLMASAILSGGHLVRFDLDLNGIASHEISGTRVQLHFRKAPDRDAIDVAASADQLHFASTLQAGFGSTLRRATLQASLVPAAPLERLFGGADAWDQALESWRHANGAFHLGELEMDWNGMHLVGSGDMGLDPEHQPQGALTLKIDGKVRLSTDKSTEGRLARAIAQLTNVANDSPQRFSLRVTSGDVNLWSIRTAQTGMSAGSIAPLY